MALRTTEDLRSYKLEARDGVLGTVKDLLFDDETWTTCYVVVDTGGWLPGRKVLIALVALGPPDEAAGRLPVDLTKEAIRNGPGIDADRPVSRQLELELLRHHGWHPYLPGPGALPLDPAPPSATSSEQQEETDCDPHLRSVSEISGYGIIASDGEIGHLEEMIYDDTTWALRYAVVDTRNWLPGKKVLVSPSWITKIDWHRRHIDVDLTRQQIETAPAYDPSRPIDREYEERLHDHYGRPKYWE